MATSADVAVLFGISEEAARDRIRAGDFRGARKLGKAWYIPLAVLEAMARGEAITP